jgi:hypothetical protein
MTNPFSTRTVTIIVVVAFVSLVTAVVLTIKGDDLNDNAPSAGADSYSVSAIGHRGLVDILQKLPSNHEIGRAGCRRPSKRIDF